jgi:HlyD family secretion protein
MNVIGQPSAWRGVHRVGLLLGAVVALAGCAGNASENEQRPNAPLAPSSTPVRVVTVSVGSLTANRSASATLVATMDSAIVAEASGRVLNILKRAGERVAAGEVVMRLENATLRSQRQDALLTLQTARVNLETAQRQNPEDRAQASRRLEAARAALETAKRTLSANRKLYEMGGVSGVELRTSQTQERQAQAELEAARSALARVERANGEGLETLRLGVSQAQARLAQLEADLARASVKAPFAGEVAEVFVQTGEFASSGTRVFRLVDPSSLRVSFNLPTSDADRLNVGSEVRVTVGARRLKAKVTQDARIPGENRLVRLRARLLPGQSLEGLTPGTVARLEYPLRVARGALVPSGALRADGGQYFVFVVKDLKAGRARVRVLGESGGRVALAGLAAGQRVVYPVPLTLEPGATVSVIGGERR